MICSKPLSVLSLAAIICLSSHPGSGRAAENDWSLNPSEVLSFADHLYETGDYHRAISEYKRFVHFFPREPRSLQARFKIGMSYQKAGYLDNAIEVMEGILADRPSAEVSRAVAYEIGKSHFLGEDYRRSAEVLERLDTERSLTLAGWSLLRAGDYAEASETFARASNVEPEGYLRGLNRTLSRESQGGESLSGRSPLLAALLSTPVPGAGRVYCGRVGDGVFSFLIVAASYAGAYGYYQEEEYPVSLGFLAIGILFHAGDIYGAVNSARFYNIWTEEAFKRGIEDRHNLGGILLD